MIMTSLRNFMVCENMGIFLKNPHISHHINIPRKVIKTVKNRNSRVSANQLARVAIATRSKLIFLANLHVPFHFRDKQKTENARLYNRLEGPATYGPAKE